MIVLSQSVKACNKGLNIINKQYTRYTKNNITNIDLKNLPFVFVVNYLYLFLIYIILTKDNS